MITFKKFITESSPITKLNDEEFIINNPNGISWVNVNRLMRLKGYDVRGADDVKNLIMKWHSIRYEEPQGQIILKSIKSDFKPKEEIPKGKQWETAAKRYFGITNNGNEAGYIFQDGSMLDMSGYKHGGSKGIRNYDHRQLNYAPALEKAELFDTSGMLTFMNETGAIRLIYSNGYLNFDFIRPISRQQVNTLRKLINGKNELYADQTDVNGNTLKSWYFEFGKQYHIEQIVKERI